MGRIVCAVTVGNHVDLSLDFSEHPAYNTPLAGTGFVSHHCTSLSSDMGCAISGGIVIYVDNTLGKGLLKPGDYGADGGLLVEARHQHGDAGLR